MPEFLYIPNGSKSNVLKCSPTAATILATIAEFGSNTVFDVALSPDESTLYVGHSGGVTILDATDGYSVIDEVTGFSALCLALTPDGATLFVAADEELIKKIDTATLGVTSVSPSGETRVFRIAVSPSGTHYGYQGNFGNLYVRLISDDSEVGTYDDSLIGDVAWGDDKFYWAGSGGDRLRWVESDGTFGEGPVYTNMRGVAYNASGDKVYGSFDDGFGTSTIRALDPDDGSIISFALPINDYGSADSGRGKLAASQSSNRLYCEIISGTTDKILYLTHSGSFTVTDVLTESSGNLDPQCLRVLGSASPVITSFSPTSGPVGTMVTITGINLSGVTGAKAYNNQTATVGGNASTQVVITIPSGATTGPLSVTTDYGTATSSDDFTVSAEAVDPPELDTETHISFKYIGATFQGLLIPPLPIGATSWKLYTAGGSLIASGLAGGVVYERSGLTANTEYGYKLKASNSAGDSDFTDPDYAWTSTGSGGGGISVPDKPDAPTVTPDFAERVFTVSDSTWDATETKPITSAGLRRRVNGSTIEVLAPSWNAQFGIYPDEDIEVLDTVEYSVRHSNAAGDSVWSDWSEAVSLISPDAEIEILEPDGGDTVRRIVPVLVQASGDGVAIEDVRLYVGSVLVGTLTEPNYPPDEPTDKYLFNVDLRSWPNKSYVVRAEADTDDGLGVFDTISITLNNDLSTDGEQAWTQVLPTAGIADAWPVTNANGDNRVYHRATVSLTGIEKSEDNADNFAYTIYGNTPGTSTDLSDYQVLDDKRHALLLNGAQSFRFVIAREPLLVRSTFELFDASEAIRLHPYTKDGEKVAILTREPNQVLSFDGSAVELIADLSGFEDLTPVDFAFLDNRFYVLMQPVEGAPASVLPQVRAIDLDATDKPYRLLPDENNSPLTAIALFGGRLWIAATTGVGEATIYSFGSGDLQQPVEVATVPPVVRFDTRNGQAGALRAACEGGEIYAISEEGAELIRDTNQERVLSLYGDGAMLYAGTGDDGRLYTNRGGTWGMESEFDLTEVRALAALNSSVYLGGDSALVYQRRSGGWQPVDELGGVTAINDMVEYKGSLLFAVTGEEAALLHRRQVSVKKGVIARTVGHFAFGLELKDES